MQVLANGFVVGPHSYLHSSWNIMDGSLVMLSLFDVAVSLSAAQGQRNSLGILRVFRLLRTLRPLRFVLHALCFTANSPVCLENNCLAVAEMGDRFAAIDVGRCLRMDGGRGCSLLCPFP